MNELLVKRGDSMRIVCIGGGPAGLYFAILMKLRDPSHRVSVIERNRADDTFGWGVVFSDQTMGNFRAADPETHGAILGNFHHWDDIAIHFAGRKLVSGGHGFCGIGRKKLLQILQDRAQAVGVHQSFQHEVEDDREFADADLVIADRIKRMIAEDQPVLLAFDENAWITRLDSQSMPLEEAVSLLTANRQWVTRILRKCSETDFARAGMHSEAGRKTLADLVAGAVGHVDHHLRFLYGKRASLGAALPPHYAPQ